MKNNHIVVTGGGGYIGTTLVPILLEEGYRVTVIDRFFFGKELLTINKNLKLVQEDSRKLRKEHFLNTFAVIDLVAISNDPSGELYSKATYQINRDSRVRTAKLAKDMGVQRYILPSSCSIYGFTEGNVVSDETSITNPLTVYAKANEEAEKGVLKLSDSNFCVTVLRQATVYGYSPRMRFDLAINGMTYGAWQNRKIPLMRDGNQWRPMIHVIDTARAQLFFLKQGSKIINNQIFNVGSDSGNYRIKDLAKIVKDAVGIDISIEWYGDPDHRSYKISFNKLAKLGFTSKFDAKDGVIEIIQKLNSGELKKTERSITLDWYNKLNYWHNKIKKIELHDGILDI